MTGPTLSIAALQLNSGADVQANLACIRRLLPQTAGARLVLLPENALFLGARERDKLAVAEAPGEGPLQQALSAMARDHDTTLVCGSFPLRLPDLADKVSASALVYGPDGRQLARYDKRHLFDVALEDGKTFLESKHFQAGDNPPQCFDCDGVTVGLSICYDLRFPELYRDLSAAGAQVLLVPAAFTWPTGQAHWEVLLRARAVENLAAVVGANQCGEHPNGQRSWGHSMIIDCWGRIQAQAGEKPGVIRAEIDLDSQARRRREFPVLRHRRDGVSPDQTG